MGDPEYARNTMKKIRSYEKHHMFPGNEVIYTFESDEVQINVESIEDIIVTYFGRKYRPNLDWKVHVTQYKYLGKFSWQKLWNVV